MRIISANLNGVRAAAKKGFFEWVLTQEADVICLQELRAEMDALDKALYSLKGYHHYFLDAKKKGYSGVGIYTQREPDRVVRGLGWDLADTEGRYIQVDFGRLSIASLYMPSGTSGDHRQAIKFDFLERFYKVLKKMEKENRHFIICGDWNIVHKEIDIKNFKSNQKTSGCLPEERAWLDQVFGKDLKFVDAFRVVDPRPEQYTWWSHRARAREKNVGWRIDYQVISPALASKVKRAEIYKDQFFSDHAPLIIDYDVEI